MRRAITKGAGADVELELVAQGLRRSIRAQVAPLPKRQGVVAVLHDVTQLKRADAVRAAGNGFLDMLVGAGRPKSVSGR